MKESMTVRGNVRDLMMGLLLIVLVGAVLAGCATGSGGLAATVVETERDDAERDEEKAAERGEADQTDPASRNDGDDAPGGNEDGAEDDGVAIGASANGDDGDEEAEHDLVISTTPVDALVYIDGSYLGRAPVRITTVEPGRYTVRVEAEGYVGVIQTIRIDEDSQVDLTIRLEPITGHLRLTGDVAESSVRLNGSAASSVAVDRQGMEYELPIGRYRVVVERFGYESFRSTVEIRENRTSTLDVSLEPLDFAIQSVHVTRRRFSPTNGGALGRTILNFTVTTPGRGNLQVENAEGTVVYREQLGPFRGPNQRVSWDGTVSAERSISSNADSSSNAGSSSKGSVTGLAPDGRYLLRLEGVGDGFDGADQVAQEIVVDSSLVIRARRSMSGVSGLSYAAGPDTLPEGTWQLATTAIGHRVLIDGEWALRLPSFLSLRSGVGGDTEIAAQAGASFVSGAAPRWFAAASVKTQLLRRGGNPPLISAAVAGRAALRGTGGRASVDGPDTLTNFPGIAVSTPIALGRSLRLTVTPEIVFSPARVYYGTDKESLNEIFGPAADGGEGWSWWLYGRAGLMYETPAWSVGLSAALRSTPADRGLGIDLPMQAGAEGHVMIPGTTMFVSGILGAEASAVDNFYLIGGGSVGVLF